MAREIKQIAAVSEAGASMTDSTHPSFTVIADTDGNSVWEVKDISELLVFVRVHQAPDGTSPTLDVKLQESIDKNNWTDLSGASITQMTALGVESIQIPGPAVTDAKSFGPYVRAMAAVGGTNPVFTVTVQRYGKE